MSKIGYAQSSDIRARSWEQYRHDMKKKAIRELECIPLLRDLLVQEYGDSSVVVTKYGTDADLWFSGRGRLTGKPDYLASWSNGRERLYEFQMAIEANLPYYDFKVSKVRRKRGGRFVPLQDRDFFYVVRPERKVGFLEPKWIMDQGTVSGVPAWGNRTAYRVRREVFLPALRDGDDRLIRVMQSIADRESLLEAQVGVLPLEMDRLAARVSASVEGRRPFAVLPSSLDGVFEACVLMSTLRRMPGRPGEWIRQVFASMPEEATPEALARIMFSIDFLYFQYAADPNDYRYLTRGEQRDMVRGLERVDRAIRDFGWPGVDGRQGASKADVRRMVFVVNLFEDLRQDVAVDPEIVEVSRTIRKARRIFESVPHVRAAARLVRQAGD